MPTPAEAPPTVPRLSSLEPVEVARGEEVDQVVRSARAGIAILSLQLRSVQQAASVAEVQEAEWSVDAVRQFLGSSLESRLARRRDEMARELERVRSEAARLVLATRATAAELVAQAGEETLAVLLAGSTPLPAVPSLRIITERPYPMDEPGRRPEVLAPGHPAVRSDPAFTAIPPVERSVPDSPPVAAIHEVAVITLPETTTASPVVPPTVVPAPVVVAANPALVSEAPRPSRVSRFLYADVLLPMVAVLLLLVLLLAWVG